MVGMSLLVMKLSSFLPFSVGGHSGGVSVWVSRLMALRSPAVPIRYLPFTHILDVSALRVFTCVGMPFSSQVLIRVSATSSA